MANPQLCPLKFDPQTGELYLELREHKNIRVTTLRESDAAQMIEILNHESICDCLEGPPFPYLQEHFDWWYNHRKSQSEISIQALEAAKDVKEPIFVDDCIVTAIREMKEDGSSPLIGAVGISKCPWMEFASPGLISRDESEALRQENDSRKAGDPEIVWTVGYYISPTHKGKGIVTDAAKTLLLDWAVPRMNVRRMVGSAFQGNDASVKIQEKLGFKFRSVSKNHKEVKGKMRDICILDWNLELRDSHD